jgi:hypothetical protein
VYDQDSPQLNARRKEGTTLHATAPKEEVDEEETLRLPLHLPLALFRSNSAACTRIFCV